MKLRFLWAADQQRHSCLTPATSIYKNARWSGQNSSHDTNEWNEGLISPLPRPPSPTHANSNRRFHTTPLDGNGTIFTPSTTCLEMCKYNTKMRHPNFSVCLYLREIGQEGGDKTTGDTLFKLSADQLLSSGTYKWQNFLMRRLHDVIALGRQNTLHRTCPTIGTKSAKK